jgi:hypothetical protein
MKYQKITLVLMVILIVVLIPFLASGHTWWSGQSSSGYYSVEILVNGRTCPVMNVHGRSYIQGHLGQRYVIRIHNRSPKRVEAVVAVDGRDVIDGRRSDLGKRGYVIAAYSYVDIDGFRLNMDEVAAFRFTTVPDSYASRMGTPWEVGIVGVAIFPEKTRRYIPRRPLYDRKSKPGWRYDMDSSGAAERAPAPQSKNLGTQFGERTYSAVSETRFIRQNSRWPAARLSIRYDDREGLCAIGVGSFCYPPYRPPYEPPYEPPREFSTPPPGWEHFSSWY